MSYSPYYTGGWQTGETGGTPITPAALNHMESGIDANDAAIADNTEDITELANKIGNSSMGTTATTVTGAIAEHESDITALNGKFTFVKVDGDLGALAAGAAGFSTISVTIPSGYITTGICTVNKKHIAGAAGLTIHGNVMSGLSGTATVYPSYYTPGTVSSGNADYSLHILCIKS